MEAATAAVSVNDSNCVLETTKSVCPQCLKVIDAEIINDNGAVFMKKSCSEHGSYRAYLWPDVDHYKWSKSFAAKTLLPSHPQPVDEGCPNDCGLCVSHQNHPRLVELELTHRCNLRCPLCFMSANDNQTEVPADLSLAEIEKQLALIAEQVGIQTSIQLTGGEPTIRRDLVEIVKLCKKAGFSAIEVNTNGIQVGRNPEYIKHLAAAGITGVYMQFDGLTDRIYQQIRGKDLLRTKLQAIENCRAANVQVVLSVAVVKGINDTHLGDILRFALGNISVIAGVAYQPAFISGRFDLGTDHPLTMGDVIFALAEQSNGIIRPYDLWPTRCSHPLCDSTTYIIRQPGGKHQSIGQLIDVEKYRQHNHLHSPQGSVLPDMAHQLYPELDMPGLSILIMNYMSANDFDLSRLQQCSMTVAGADGTLIPFCAYQLTNVDGLKAHEIKN